MMRVLFFFILSLISIYYVQSDSVPCKICAYQGDNRNGKFILEDVPAPCDAILYGGNYFNEDTPKADTDAITALKKAGKLVYMLYMYGNDVEGSDLASLASSKAKENLDQYMTPMTSYLSTNKIDGVIFAYLHINENSPPCYDVSVNYLLSEVKKKLPSIKIGLMLPGYEANQWHIRDFDFTVINANVDFYAIDASGAGNACTASTRADGGLTPLTSNDPTVTPITDICKFTSSSKMDQSKVFINVLDGAFEGDSTSKPISEYCLASSKGAWCVDSLELIRQQITYFKKTFKGMVLAYLNNDDMDNSCKCGKYPMANAYFDAWDNKPVKCCDAIS